ncbi:MAG: bifunctional UDP-N-acetylglucosamine diphosphorylase/glucosamine-1-phosphate N-acetyltransferase GlmU [Acidimicrobiales bacterium]
MGKEWGMAALALHAIVLAAGEGTRMRSERPKPLHRLCGRSMAAHVLDALAELELELGKVVVVVGHRAPLVTKTLSAEAPGSMRIEFVEQAVARGTGDATAVALGGLPEDDEEADVVVLPGDTPLLRPPTLAALVRHHRRTAAAATLLSAVLDEPTGYGRVVRSESGAVLSIAEDTDATEQQREIKEVGTSIYCFRRSLLAPALRRLSPANFHNEYYLTDVIGVLSSAGYPVSALVCQDPVEAAGVNDRAQLAVAEAEVRDRINERWMRRGVTMWDPERTYVDAGVELSPDVALWPGVVLRGRCVVGRGTEIGPDVTLVDTLVGEGGEVRCSVCEGATIGPRARVGPFVHLGPGAVVSEGEIVGPFESRPHR